MNSQNFNNGNCGQSNPIANLDSHITQDQICLPHASNQLVTGFAQYNATVPQTFRMNDLQPELQNSESQRNDVPPELLGWDLIKSDIAKFEVNVHPKQEPHGAEINSLQHQSGAYQQSISQPSQNSFYPHHQTNSSYNEGYPSLPLETNNQHYNEQLRHEKSEENSQSTEEFSRLPEQEELIIKSEDDFAQLEIKMEYEDIKEETKQKKVFYFDGLFVEEAFNVPAPDVEWSESENFFLFVCNCERQGQNHFDLNIVKEFKFTENNPNIIIENPFRKGLMCLRAYNYAEASLCFEAAVQRNEYDATSWEELIGCLHQIGQTHEAIYLTKKYLHLNPNDFSRKLYCFLFKEQYYYQGCQIILNWLKNHPIYSDIAPSNFILEDKTSNLIETEQLEELEKILIEAALRCRYKPDHNVQIALSMVAELSREYSKSRDYWITLLGCDKSWPCQELGWLMVAINALRNNEPHKAIMTLKKIRYSRSPEFCIQCLITLGLINMYLRNYKEAGQYVLAAIYTIYNTHGDITTLNEAWFQLCLCSELMRRDDLRNLVHKKYFYALCEKFDYQPTTSPCWLPSERYRRGMPRRIQ